MSSILTEVKKMLGIEAEYTHFDPDITIFINSVLMSVTQIGIGPKTGFIITDATDEWSDLIGTREDLEAVKIFIGLKVRLLFDPPATSTLIEAIERQILEVTWRLNVQVEGGAIVG